MSNVSIPVVDLADFRSGDPERKARFVQAIGEAYTTIGFAAISNHGVDSGGVDRFYDQVKAYFSLPAATKLTYEIAELAGQRGYTSFGREHAKGSDAPDLKEFWQFGQNRKAAKAAGVELGLEDYPPNIEVTEVPDFNRIGLELFANFERSGRDILASLALYLGLDEDWFDGHIRFGNSILRAIHYPPITQEPKSSIRAEQHEDINLITLLVGASAAGLQVQTREGDWVDVRTEPDQIVVNVGDMLQRLTNNKLRSTTHRVVNPPRELWHTSRLSIPFFLHPRSEMPLNCLDSCVDTGNPKAYDDTTAGAYLHERLVEIGLKKA